MSDKIPTAEELFNQIYMITDGVEWTKDVKKVAIEVAKNLSKLHVEAALKAASESKSSVTAYTADGLNYQEMKLTKESILSAYPLTNIK